jgi:hypothetical protein
MGNDIMSFIATIFTLMLSSNTFLVMGDMPYSAVDEVNLTHPDGVLAQGVANTAHGFLLHLGDMKAGSHACTNKRLQANKALLYALTAQPFIYVMGDNEWTDCDRLKLSPRFNELERLNYVKGLMYDEAYLGKAKQLTQFTTHPKQIENARWQFNDIEFITLHITGTHNGRTEILMSDKATAIALADKRDEINVKWIKQSLVNQQAQAYVIGFQADIYNKDDCSGKHAVQCDSAFKLYRDAITEFASNTEKPVLVMHGDTGPYCIRKLADNLTQLNVPGDYAVSDIAKVTLLRSENNEIQWDIRNVSDNKALTTPCY